jgi:hypothetical protein
MYARLWWKDARQLWPIWVVLGLGAAAGQALVLKFASPEAREGTLLSLMALTWASFYALAAGAAAFAGEREAGTLRLLDILPVSRRTVWAGKVSFALATTLVLALVLLGMVALSTERPAQKSLTGWGVLTYALVVLAALGWGLFWSAILNSALSAAVIAVCCTALSLSFLPLWFDALHARDFPEDVFARWQLALVLATIAASNLLFTWRARLPRMRVQFRSPIVLTPADSPGASHVQLPIPSSVAMEAVAVPRPVIRPAEAVPVNRPLRQSWAAEARVLAWQTMREGWRIWCLLAVIALVLPPLSFLRWGYFDPALLAMIDIGMALVAGVSVFGPDNRARTHQFLAHHAARPSVVWLVKLVVWGVGLALLLAPQVLMTQAWPEPFGLQPAGRFVMVFTIPLGFTIALLCGMAIRRGITAAVFALVTTLTLAIFLGTLVVAVSMLPPLGLLVISAALLGISWAWCGDWIMDRPGPGRWLRLGLLFFGTFAVLFGWYAGFRAWSVPDVGPIAVPRAWIDAAAGPLQAEQGAAPLYREAGSRLIGPWDSPKFLSRNRAVLDLVRRAAARPGCRFQQWDRLASIDPLDLPPLDQFALLLTLDVHDRQDRGDLAGAWDDLVMLFRMARHFSEGAGLHPASFALSSMERDALSLAMEWAISRGQTPQRLHAALATYRDLPKMPPVAEVVQAEANLTEKTLDLPSGTLRNRLLESMNEPRENPSGQIWASAWLDVITTPWERSRTRRVNRLLAAAAIRASMLEPWQRAQHAASHRFGRLTDRALLTTPLAKRLVGNMAPYVEANDLNEVARRALVQILAIRAWQLKHGGGFPDHLAALVPEELPRLLIDPYAGRPFGYIRWTGRRIVSLREALEVAPRGQIPREPTPGSWLLYSVGPDRHDDKATTFVDNGQQPEPFDIVFAIPPVDSGAGAGQKP